MLLITCPATRTDELVSDRRIRSVTNSPTAISLHVECPACGAVHVYRTGRRWEAARAQVAARTEAAARATTRAAVASSTAAAARAAQIGVPA